MGSQDLYELYPCTELLPLIGTANKQLARGLGRRRDNYVGMEPRATGWYRGETLGIQPPVERALKPFRVPFPKHATEALVYVRAPRAPRSGTPPTNN